MSPFTQLSLVTLRDPYILHIFSIQLPYLEGWIQKETEPILDSGKKLIMSLLCFKTCRLLPLPSGISKLASHPSCPHIQPILSSSLIFCHSPFQTACSSYIKLLCFPKVAWSQSFLSLCTCYSLLSWSLLPHLYNPFA